MKYFSKTDEILEFLSNGLQASGLFESALVTGSSCSKESLSLVDDIDLIVMCSAENQLKANQFLDSLNKLLLIHLDYTLFIKNGPVEKLHLIWTSFFIQRQLFGDSFLEKTAYSINDFKQCQKAKTKSKIHFPHLVFEEVFPRVGNYYSLKILKNFIAEYSYILCSDQFEFYDKENLLKIVTTNEKLNFIKDHLNRLESNSHLIIESDPHLRTLYKIFLLLEDLHEQYLQDKYEFCR